MMHSLLFRLAALSTLAIAATGLPCLAQDPANVDALKEIVHQPIPNLIRSTGSLPQNAGTRLVLRFAIYGAEESVDPLWTEEQPVEFGAHGEYSVLLGGTSEAGLPQDLFSAGEPRWLGIQSGNEAEKRTLLTSVPYALKAADTDTLGGLTASNFVTQQQLENRFKATAAALAEQAIQPLVAGSVTGSGTTGTVPLWTGALTQGNSDIVQLGSNIGINQATPTATLDVGGSENVRGILALPALGSATATAGQRSQLLQLSASAWSSTANAAIAPTFKILTNFVNNNTASPSGQLEFHYQQGTASLNVLSIAGNGVISFAPSQTFPGTLKSVAAASPVTATTTSGAVSLGLDTSALQTTLNTVYPQLGTYNTFASGATFGAETTLNGSSTDWMMVVTNQSTQSKGTLLAQAAGNMLGIEGASPGGSAIVGSTTTGIGLTGQTYGEGAAAYLWSQANTTPNTQIVSAGQGDGLRITTHNGNALTSTSLNGYGGLFNNNSTYQATVYATNSGTGNAGYFGNNSSARVALAGVNSSTDNNAIATYGSVSNGYGVYGISTAGTGTYGTTTSGTGVIGASSSGTGILATSNSGTGLSVSSASGTGLSASSSSGTALEVIAGSHLGLYSHRSSTSSQASKVGGLPAVWGDMPGSGVAVAIAGTTDDGVAGLFLNNSTGSTTLTVSNASTGGTGNIFNTFMATTPDGVCGVGGGGTFSCTGQMKTLVPAGGGTREVETYAVQSPENWMEDFGSGSLQKGVAVVVIDRTFAETVSDTSEYHVFLTPRGDSKGLYVINETANSFEVRESGGGVSSLAFDYRIVAKRRGFEGQRHVDVTDSYRAAMAQTATGRKPSHTGESAGNSLPIVAPIHSTH